MQSGIRLTHMQNPDGRWKGSAGGKTFEAGGRLESH